MTGTIPTTAPAGAPTTRRPRLDAQALIDAALTPRDAPTPQFERHHDVVARSGGDGRRVRTRLERLLIDGFIGPEQCEAGRRFRMAWEVASSAGGRASFLGALSARSIWSDNATTKFEAAARCREAIGALAAVSGSRAAGLARAEWLRRIMVDDASFAELGRELSVHPTTARRRVIQGLRTLANYHAEQDRVRGTDTMPHSVKDALARFEPQKDDASPEAA